MSAQSQLRIVNKTSILIGAAFMTLGSALAYFFLATTDIHCNRTTDRCVVSTQRIIGPRNPITLHLSEISRVDVVRSRSRSDSGGYLYQSVLRTGSDDVPLTPYGSSGRQQHDQLAADINQFLADSSRETLTREFTARWSFIMLFFPVAGVLIVFGSRSVVELSVNTDQSVLHLLRRRWWQTSGQEVSIALSQIDRIDVESRGMGQINTERRRSRSRGRNPTYRAVIVRKSGEHVPLFNAESSGQGAFRRADQLREFLQHYLEK